MIPKVIHYCGFGKKPMPDFLNEYINSGKEYCPDYKFIKWDESNFDVSQSKYTYEAHKSNHSAFIPDYVRLFALYNYGGIYLDTDILLFKNLDKLLDNKCFFVNDIRGSSIMPCTAFFGSEAKNKVIKFLLDKYDSMSFEFAYGKLNTVTSNEYFRDFLKNYGGKQENKFQKFQDCVFYPSDYCYSYDVMRANKPKSITYAYHRSTSLCYNKAEQKINNRTDKLGNFKKKHIKFFRSKIARNRAVQYLLSEFDIAYTRGLLHIIDDKHLSNGLKEKKYGKLYKD